MTTQENTPSAYPKEIASILSLNGFQVKSFDPSRIIITRNDATRPYDSHMIPTVEIETLRRQLRSPISPLSEYAGLTIPADRYFEMPVQNISIRARRLDPRIRIKESEQPPCRHSSGEPLPSVVPPNYQTNGTVDAVPRVQKLHLSDPRQDTCIEISWASPCGILWGPPNSRSWTERFMSSMSVKIEFGDTTTPAEIETKGKELAYSLLYELNIRNGVALEPISLAEFEQKNRYTPRKPTPPARFPSTAIKKEVAELFMFAEGARANPSLAFLSYYQVLEYFFPFAVRRSTLRKVRKEISDPLFDRSSDDSLIRILSVAEAATQTSEATQISVLITESVRDDLLLEFFGTDNDWGQHFSSSGPISGVESINLKNKTKTLQAQVADRVYRIRNRIVHAKDDPKYANVRVLLPKSREAYALEPDIQLVRLLATEVILDSQAS
ncbi:hypothetical protein [Streptomyces specialis]|uniref:hypothetical protein n=1 Tax=Streptomyces specialis TaxID=498367 RepID=UPI000B260AC5|nr:hypothetical protein [Streptomyces specialis]